MSLFERWLRDPSRLVEGGLMGLETALRAGQQLFAGLAGTNGRGTRGEEVDRATAELGNRLAGLLRDEHPWPELPAEILEAARASFSFAENHPPREWPALAAQLPFSFATLMAQEALRAYAAAQVVPGRKLPDFFEFVVETFTDLPRYFGLRYPREIERLRERLAEDPGDDRSRLELGRIYLKCGLFEEAGRELRRAGRNPALRRDALYQSMIAAYRAGESSTAIRDGVECLRLDPEDPQARYWLWLASRKAGGYPATIPAELRMEALDGYHPTQLELVDVAAEIGLDKTAGGRGTAVLDSDGNGLLDVVVAGAHASLGFYRNRGDGTFRDATLGSGLEDCLYGFAVVAGDTRNRGRQDLFVTSMGFFDGGNRLYRNGGDGTFTDITREAGLESWGPSFTAAWMDYDGDGWLDLYVVNNLGGLFDRKVPNQLFHNNGDGTFTEVAREAGLETYWQSLGAAWGDFGNRGLPDLFVSNLGRAQLFRNNGDGTFTDVSREAGVDEPALGSVALVADIDDDGWLDIVQTTYSRPADAIETLRTGRGPADGSPMRIYRNNRDGTFTRIEAELGATGCWGTMSAAAGDLTNSGHLDLALGNGDPSMDRSEATVLLAGDGSGLRNITFSAGLPFTGKGHGINLADLRGDGRLHLLVASGGLYPGDLDTAGVYAPRRLPGGYLNVRLEGRASNRDAMGARLRLLAGGREQHRLVSGGTGFGCLPLEQHFGLGSLEKIDALEILWPAGSRQRIESPPANTTLRIVEGEAGWREVYRPVPEAAPGETTHGEISRDREPSRGLPEGSSEASQCTAEPGDERAARPKRRREPADATGKELAPVPEAAPGEATQEARTR